MGRRISNKAKVFTFEALANFILSMKAVAFEKYAGLW
jgi:hypothetical protein